MKRKIAYADPDFAAEMRELERRHNDRTGVTGHGKVVDESGMPMELNGRWAELNARTTATPVEKLTSSLWTLADRMKQQNQGAK